jgi:hypothetical protein
MQRMRFINFQEGEKMPKMWLSTMISYITRSNISKIIFISILTLISNNSSAESHDPIRGKACEEYLKSRSTATNKYTGQKYSKFIWWSIYENQGMWKRPQFGENYLLRFLIQSKDENGSLIGESIQYYCISDLRTKKVIGFELDPVQ